MRYRIGICDGDYHYVVNLMEFVNSRKDTGVNMVAFSSVEAIREYLDRNYLDGIMLGESLIWGQEIEGVSVMRLTERRVLREGCVYKYQSGEAIAEDILRCLKVLTVSEEGACKGGAFLAVYSPLGRCGKTQLAKGICCNNQRSLYISMEEYGRRNALGEEILYNLVFQNDNLLQLIGRLKNNQYGFQEITGILSYQDIRLLKKENISWLKQQLFMIGDYGRVVFDIGAAALWSLDILGVMDRIYVPVLEDEASGIKLQAFREVLKGDDYGGISEKLVYLSVPNCGFSSEIMKDFVCKGEL